MRIQTLLNRVHPLKSFVYSACRLELRNAGPALVAEIRPRLNGKVLCSGCGKPRKCYDRQSVRQFEFVPLWNIPVQLEYRMRRVNCPECGVKVEKVPWADGKSHTTKAFQLFLARWARRLSWKETAESFHTSWDTVYRSVKAIVNYGLAHRNLDGVMAIGVDEIQYGKGHQYLTVVYQIDAGMRRLLFVGKDRTAKTLLRIFRAFGRDRCARLEFVCSDMWRAYLKVIAKKAPQALHVLDRFHIIQHLNKAVNQVRIDEVKRLRQEGCDDEVLKHTKYCLLKNPENLTEKQALKLNDVLTYDLKSVRAYLLKESFQLFWNYTSPYWAEWYLKKWSTRAMRSRLDPMKKFVGTIRRHQPLILNWFKAKKAYSSGVVEGLNRKVNLVTRKAYGFRSYEVLEIALFHTMGDLPEPEATHRFC
ncbi:ISL3 family transposase [Verrucomicrobia bacterium S94]|nr:ISL3 family transposase [Verrucomicrobia bacterium S94]QBG49290.1 ISL3 family transposase [Verrucomicrobia bacterium S94]